MDAHTITGNISKIKSNGTHDVYLTSITDGFTVESSVGVKVYLEDDILMIESSTNSGGISIVNGCSSSYVNYNGCSSSYVSYGGNSISVNDGVVSFVGNPGRIVVNGKEIDISHVNSPEDKHDDAYSKKWTIKTSSKINSVSLTGRNRVYFKSNLFGEKLTLLLSGSGDICLPHIQLNSCKVKLIGSGDIILGGSEINEIDVSLTGSGDVRDFHVLSAGEFNLLGSGDIRGTASNSCSIDKTRLGSGDIIIKKIH